MIYCKENCQSVREEFKRLYKAGQFVIDKTGQQVVEIIGATFIADEPAIFGTPNESYIARELAWYNAMSLNVNDIPGGPPPIWKKCATLDGRINSNYGYLIFSEENGNQFGSVIRTLEKDPFSRRAEMIYTRPSIQTEYNKDGMSDFICTDSVQYFIRDNKLHAHVRMRSNDLFHGYRNDYAWQKYVLEQLYISCTERCKLDGLNIGSIIWTAGSLHMYPSAFKYLDDNAAKD